MQLRIAIFRHILPLITVVTIGGFGAAKADFENLWTAGHGDISIHYDPANNDMELGYHLGSTAVINGSPLGAETEVNASYLTAIVPNESFSKISGGAAGLPGAFGSQTFWYIPQTNPGINPVPFAGIGAEEVPQGIFVNNSIGFSLKSIVDSPADSQFIVYRNSISGPETFIDTQNLGTSNFLSVPASSHRHFNFGFSEPGTYLLEFEAVGTLVGGGTASASAVYAFTVVPEPAAWISMSMALISIGAARQWRKTHSNGSDI